MPRLISPRSGTDDRGAVAVVVALLLAGGVLLGAGAIAVDVGQLYVEHEDVQAGADAAALAVASACAVSGPGCASVGAVAALAQDFADRNAADGRHRLVEICGRLPGVLSPCAGEPGGDLTDCVGTPPGLQAYVEVRLATELPGSRFVLPPVLAGAMSGYTGASVAACARATWQPASNDPIIGFSISTCEFASRSATDDGRRFASNPPRVRDEYTIDLLLGSYSGRCPDPDGRWRAPDRASILTSCEVEMPDDGVLRGDYVSVLDLLGALPCIGRLRQAVTRHEVVLLPVHDGVDSGRFRHTLVAPFMVTGFRLGPIGSGQEETSWLTGEPACPELLRRCLLGLFLGPATVIDQRLGDATVELIG